MRITLALIIWLSFVGGLAFYMQHRDAAALRSKPQVDMQIVEGSYALEITTTFAAEPDPFALRREGEEELAALLVRLGNKEILRINDRLEAGTPIRLEPMLGLVEGTNEIYLEASPPLEEAGKSHAIRVHVQRDGQSIADQTFWSSPGGKVANTMRFELKAAEEVKEEHER